MALHAAQGPADGRAADAADPRPVRLLRQPAGRRPGRRSCTWASSPPTPCSAVRRWPRSPACPSTRAIVIIGLISVVATIVGYRLIHAVTRGAVRRGGRRAARGVRLDHRRQRRPRGRPGTPAASAGVGFMATLSVAALWQIAYAPYVSDYTRYMPKDTGAAGGVLGHLHGLRARLGAADAARRAGRRGAAHDDTAGRRCPP